MSAETSGGEKEGLSLPFYSDECFVIDLARINDIQAAVDEGEIDPFEAEDIAISFGYLGSRDRYQDLS